MMKINRKYGKLDRVIAIDSRDIETGSLLYSILNNEIPGCSIEEFFEFGIFTWLKVSDSGKDVISVELHYSRLQYYATIALMVILSILSLMHSAGWIFLWTILLTINIAIILACRIPNDDHVLDALCKKQPTTRQLSIENVLIGIAIGMAIFARDIYSTWP